MGSVVLVWRTGNAALPIKTMITRPKKEKQIIGLTGVYIFLVCVISGHAYSTPFNATPIMDTKVETRVYLRPQCILSESKKRDTPKIIGALAGLFVPTLIDKGLGAIGGALKKAGAPETLRDTAKYPTSFYQVVIDANSKKGILDVNPALGCVVVVRGVFDGPDPENSDGPSSIFFRNDGILDGKDQDSQRIGRLQDCKIPVREIAMVFEAEIRLSSDRTALSYRSRFFQVNQFQGKRSAKNRGIVIGITFSSPGAQEEGTTLSMALVNLGEVSKGTILGPSQLGRNTSWLGGLAASEEALKAVERFEKSGTYEVMPVTLEATIAETEKGNQTLVFIGDVLSASKEEASKIISDGILPKPREEARKKEADELEKLKVDEETAFEAYLSAVDEYDKIKDKDDVPVSEKNIKKFAVETSKRRWCTNYNVLALIGIAPNRSPETCQ